MGTKHLIPVPNLLQNGNQTFHSGSEPTSEYEGNAQNALLQNFAALAKRIIEKWSYRFIRLTFRSDVTFRSETKITIYRDYFYPINFPHTI